MAVISVTEDWQRRTANFRPDDAGAALVFTVGFDNQTSPKERPLLAASASYGDVRVPNMWEAHPYTPVLWVQDKDIQALSPFFYEVTVIYGVRSPDIFKQGQSPMVHPLDEPTDITWTFVTTNEPIDRDIDGNPLTNSADESFDPPITKDFHDLVLRIERNRAAYSALMAGEYIGAVNSDNFWDFPPRVVRCMDFSAKLMRTGTTTYWRVTYEFQIRFNFLEGTDWGWRRRILDQGFRVKAGADENNKPIYQELKDEDDNKLSQPVKLDGNGQELGVGDVPVFLKFGVCSELPFSQLGLD